ncbi:MAG: HAD hydrolase-like protein, partial [Gammaproteobacteria bacterium]
EKMAGLVEAAGGRLGGVFYCPHHPDDDCDCRKPRTGLLEAIEREYGLSVAGCYFVGDSVKDVECALAKGAVPLLVLTGNGRSANADLVSRGIAARVFDDLAAVARELVDAA